MCAIRSMKRRLPFFFPFYQEHRLDLYFCFCGHTTIDRTTKRHFKQNAKDFRCSRFRSMDAAAQFYHEIYVKSAKYQSLEFAFMTPKTSSDFCIFFVLGLLLYICFFLCKNSEKIYIDPVKIVIFLFYWRCCYIVDCTNERSNKTIR